jgi:hypothetical protein
MHRLVLLVAVLAGCSSPSTILDRSTLKVSESARVSARNLVSDVEHFPQVGEHLALAQEVYQKQLYLLKERRNQIRAKRRAFGVLSFAVMSAGAVGTAGLAIRPGDDADVRLDAGAALALTALAAGTALQIGSLMQEDTSSVDAKVDQLELLYDTMMDRLRELGRQAAAPVCDPTEDEDCPAVTTPVDELAARMGEAIEEFISAALAIHVKG